LQQQDGRLVLYRHRSLDRICYSKSKFLRCRAVALTNGPRFCTRCHRSRASRCMSLLMLQAKTNALLVDVMVKQRTEVDRMQRLAVCQAWCEEVWWNAGSQGIIDVICRPATYLAVVCIPELFTATQAIRCTGPRGCKSQYQ
jgi:hypothetical protein